MRCPEDVWLCMCGSVCVVLIIITCPRCSSFCNVKNNNNNNNKNDNNNDNNDNNNNNIIII